MGDILQIEYGGVVIHEVVVEELGGAMDRFMAAEPFIVVSDVFAYQTIVQQDRIVESLLHDRDVLHESSLGG